MSWIAVLLIRVAVTDLVRPVRETSVLPEVVGAAVAVFAGLAAGPTGWGDVVALLVIAGVVLAWGRTVWSSAFIAPGRIGAWVPLTVLGGALLVGLLLGGLASPVDGVFGRWLGASEVPVLATRSAGSALLLLAVGLLQLSTGNILVRLVLAATGTVNPSDAAANQPQAQLRGGQPAPGPAARRPAAGADGADLHPRAGSGRARHRRRDSDCREGTAPVPGAAVQDPQRCGPGGRHRQVTEYFLVGSFISWLVALGSLVLLSG